LNSVNPFLPLFVQQMGEFSNREAAFWSGVVIGASGIAMFISAPLWGVMADRWGRKPMLLRSLFGAAIVASLTGLAPNVYYLVALRSAHGVLSGTVAAASALIATTTPRDKLPFAMGLLSMAMFVGSTLGPLVGGFLADQYGYRTTFFVTAVLLLIGGVITTVFVTEKFERPEKARATSFSSILQVASSSAIIPLLVVEFTLQAGPQMIAPIIPLFIREMEPAGATATTSGLAFSLMGLLSAISGTLAGHFGGRISLKKILIFSCLGAGLLYLPPIWSVTVAQLVIFFAITGLPKGGLMTSSNAMVGLSVTQSQQGVAYGVAQSARALGNGMGPLIGGSLARLLGFKAIFGVAGGLFVIASIVVARLLKEQPKNGGHEATIGKVR
ncbi:MAG: MFS transporter, partial [Chloroflexi bacterium]|nr:MFS transporter [Chloroflexota bacterium]